MREAVGKIAGELRTALAERRQVAENGVKQIAAQMQQFLASDVIYDARVVPFIQEMLDREEIGGQTIRDSQFLPNLDWLDPDMVVAASARRRARGGGGATREPAPGTHGHGLVSTAVGDMTLRRRRAEPDPRGVGPRFRAVIANQGENDERTSTSGCASAAPARRSPRDDRRRRRGRARTPRSRSRSTRRRRSATP